MLLSEIKKYAQELVDKHYAVEDINNLVKIKIGTGTEKVTNEDGTEVKEIKLDLEEKDVEEEVAKEIEIEVKKQVKKESTKKIKDVMPRVEMSYGQHNGLKAYKTEKDAYEAGLWYKGILLNDPKHSEQAKNLWGQKTIYTMEAGTGTVATAGSYTVPDQVYAGVSALQKTYGVVRRNATMLNNVTTDTIYVPKQTTAPIAAWTAESGGHTQADSVINRSTIAVGKMTAFAKISDEMQMNSLINVSEFLSNQIAIGFSNLEDSTVFIDGDASATYAGITSIATAIGAGSQFDSGQSAWTSFDMADFLGAMAMLPQYALTGAKWYTNPAFYYTVMCALISGTSSGNTITTWEEGFNKTQAAFLGYPVEFVHSLPGSITDTSAQEEVAYFGNLGQTVWGATKGTMEIKVNPYLYMANGITALFCQQFVGYATDVNIGSASVAGSLIELKM